RNPRRQARAGESVARSPAEHAWERRCKTALPARTDRESAPEGSQRSFPRGPIPLAGSGSVRAMRRHSLAAETRRKLRVLRRGSHLLAAFRPEPVGGGLPGRRIGGGAVAEHLHIL